MSQERLALDTGFELSQIGRIERGEVNTSISHIAAIAKALKSILKNFSNFEAIVLFPIDALYCE